MTTGIKRARVARLRRILALARVEMLRLIHDPTTISLVLLVPAVQLVLFGYAINLDPKRVPIAIAGGPAGNAELIRRTVIASGYFMIVANGLQPGEAARMVAQGKALVGVELPSDQSDGKAVQEARVVVDATDPSAVRPALGALENTYWQRLAELNAIGPLPSVHVEWLYNPRGRTAWTIVPGLVGVIVMITTLMLGSLTLVREREQGSWETLLATPVSAIDALVGKLSPYTIVGSVQGVVVIFLGWTLFHFPLGKSLGVLLIAMPLYSTAHLVLGFAISGLAESQLQAIQAAVFFYLPSMLLSGFMFPFQGMPAWAQTVGEILPLTHFVRATRDVLLKGDGATRVACEMWPIALFTMVAISLALFAYKRRID